MQMMFIQVIVEVAPSAKIRVIRARRVKPVRHEAVQFSMALLCN